MKPRAEERTRRRTIKTLALPNPLVTLDITFQDGAKLRFLVDPPVEQTRCMSDIGRMLVGWGVEFDVDVLLPEVSDVHEGA